MTPHAIAVGVEAETWTTVSPSSPTLRELVARIRKVLTDHGVVRRRYKCGRVGPSFTRYPYPLHDNDPESMPQASSGARVAICASEAGGRAARGRVDEGVRTTTDEPGVPRRSTTRGREPRSSTSGEPRSRGEGPTIRSDSRSALVRRGAWN